MSSTAPAAATRDTSGRGRRNFRKLGHAAMGVSKARRMAEASAARKQKQAEQARHNFRRGAKKVVNANRFGSVLKGAGIKASAETMAGDIIDLGTLPRTMTMREIKQSIGQKSEMVREPWPALKKTSSRHVE